MPARLVARLTAQAHRLPCEPLRYGLTLAAPAIWNPPNGYLPAPPSANAICPASSSSSSRWLNRQSRDQYTRDSKLGALKSRAAFKLLEINDRYHLFRHGQTVVDLGYAPGSWSQVARNRVGPRGRVVGIDVIPAQPPRGVSTLQGDFLSEAVQARLRDFVRDEKAGVHPSQWAAEDGDEDEADAGLERDSSSILERAARTSASARTSLETATNTGSGVEDSGRNSSRRGQEAAQGRVVDVVLSDMCAPWPLERSTWINSVNNPYRRMMNTSGNPFRDHAGSMDLSLAALTFCHDCLVAGGHFLCKFYQGSEDKAFEMRLKKLFEKVHRIKPDSSRKESRESYFVALRRRANVPKEDVLGGS